ncbi:hypothetical protein J4573_05370 [Actinomadura barringtoniae]|uniref:Secreted protein n=1 Tax=Actinomadura barringtoniae TaxID=1427535 RepID=A0A939PC30_9ACTN|nr:hypothetical protein [Actinomadura barringtoniae]MBO2446509.1 hypothetical protein [Actinomadura barringtoniae]
MARIRQFASVGIAATAAVAIAVPSASAATTTIRRDSATGAAYSGNVRASLLGSATVSTSIGSGSCNESVMNGSVSSNGTGLSVSNATFSSNGGGACTGTTTATITAQNLPWSGGNVTFDSAHTGNRDASVTIANFRVKAVVNIFGGITCIYGGSLTANGYNRDNTHRPVTTNNQAQVGITNATVNKVSSGSNFLCPGTASVTANYQLQGEVTAGGGNFTQALYVTS